MHGNTFHSLWMLQLESDADIEHEEEHTSDRETSTTSSDTFLIATNRAPNHNIAYSPYKNAETVKASPSNNTTPKSPQYMLTNCHLLLLLFTSSVNACLVKVFCVFSGSIFKFYQMSFSTLTLILGIATLSTVIAVIINPYLIFLRCNMAVIVIQSVQIIAIALIITFSSDYILLTIGVCFLFNVYQIHWSLCNTIISCFVHAQNNKASSILHAAMTKKRYLTIFNTQWTVSTLYFFVVGIILQGYSFDGVLALILFISVVLAIVNAVILPKRPALPSELHLNHQIFTQLPFISLSLFILHSSQCAFI